MNAQYFDMYCGVFMGPVHEIKDGAAVCGNPAPIYGWQEVDRQASCPWCAKGVDNPYNPRTAE